MWLRKYLFMNPFPLSLHFHFRKDFLKYIYIYIVHDILARMHMHCGDILL